MKKFISLVFLSMFFIGCSKKIKEQERMCSRIDFDKIVSLFPKDVQSIHALGMKAQDEMNHALTGISSVDAHDRTFSNSIRPYDNAKLNFLIDKHVLTILGTLSSDLEMQAAALRQSDKLQSYESQTLQRNPILYNAIKEYRDHGKDGESRTQSVKRFIQKKLKEYEHAGMSLAADQKIELLDKEKRTKELEGLFRSNVAHYKNQIAISFEGLQGIPETFIVKLQKNEKGLYLLPVTFETFFVVMENCDVERTRKEYYFAFGQRGYPQNGMILKELVQARHAYAQQLGFDHFSGYQVHNQMIKTTKGVEKFLWGMVKELQSYVQKDVQELLQHIPPSVSLTDDGKIKPWDEAYIKSYYRKHYFKVHDYDLANYFPLEHTLQELLRILSTIFNVEFEQQQVEQGQLWASDVVCYRVRTLKNQGVIGYLFLDLLQREHKKDSEAYHMSILPAIKDDCDVSCVGASVTVANFAKGREGKPATLGIHDVITLLHELGHALHELLGATKFVDFAGTQVVKDFVEAPSQMLELLLKQPKTLQVISKHYQTGDSLSQNQVDQIIAAQKFGEAERTLKQLFLGLVSWYIFKEGHKQDTHALIEKIFKKVFKHIAYEKHHFFEYAFIHLMHYGASYYSYVWSQVLAADMFDHMHSQGSLDRGSLDRGSLDHAISSEYVRHILAPGGSTAPAAMVRRYLKRPFNHKAFFKQFS